MCIRDRLILAVRQTGAGGALAATLSWHDLFERPCRHDARIGLPSLAVAPPHQQPLRLGPVQRIRGVFAPGEGVSVWLALPEGAPCASSPLPLTRADESGTVTIDLRAGPRDFAAVVVQGARFGVQAVLLPPGVGSAPGRRPRHPMLLAILERVVAALRWRHRRP